MNKMNQKDKIKTFQVSLETHEEVINYCKRNSLKVNDFVSKLLLKTIRSLNEQQHEFINRV